jgi:hypothetical protein
MQISRKIELAFGVILCLLLLTSGQGLWMFIRTKAALGELRQAFSDVLLLDDLKVLIYRQAKEIPDYLTGHDPDAKEEFQSFSTQIAMRLNESDRLAGVPLQARYLGDLRQAYAAHAELAER